MFKSIVTIFRGRSHERVEAIADANAMTILDQQIRDCVQAIEATKCTLALAISQERQEAERFKNWPNRSLILRVGSIRRWVQEMKSLRLKQQKPSPKTVKDKLAAAGFGAPTSTQAQDVLARLKAKSKLKEGDA
jgi:phage shock protein A